MDARDMLSEELIAFEKEVADAFERKEIRGPIHLAGGNERQLIELFQDIKRTDFVLSTWRSHYHALLHGVPRETVMRDILAGRSMFLHYPEHRFMTSSIVAGLCSIACGLAAGGETVWCFVGDMAASTGAFEEARKFAACRELPLTFIVEDNGYSTNSPTMDCWNGKADDRHFNSSQIKTHGNVLRYHYKRTQPHCGSGTYVSF